MNEARSQLDRLIGRLGEQIDTLVPFLALGHETIYNAITPEMTPWYEIEEHPSILDTFEWHHELVAHSAFLLGYSYFEAFVSDLIWIIYRHKPTFLPPGEKLSYEAVLSESTFEGVLAKMIDQTTGAMNSLQKRLDHLERRFGIGKECPSLIQDAHVARNALIHNSGRINRLPNGHTRWKLGDTISFDCRDSYELLLAFKGFAASLFDSVESLLGFCEDNP